jgi:AraC-like DNA-binding protein
MIALDAGFADQSHFTRVFRRAFGETPGQYARALRGR